MTTATFQATSFSIHDTPHDVYAALPAEERESEGTRWKVIETPSTRVVFFPMPDWMVQETSQ